MPKTRPCALCKQRPRSSHVIGPDLCDPCHEYAGWENTHSDQGHDAMSADDPTEASYLEHCPICQDVPPPWTIKEEKIVKNATARTRTNPTTSNMSHADCLHERTPKGRAACRKALRAGTPVVAPKPQNVKLGKGIAVHRPGACVTTQRWDGAIERTDADVTCKNCLKTDVLADA